MQLQMTAPLDIGLEQTDASLGLGQDDFFDLTQAEREARRKDKEIDFANGDLEMQDSDAEQSEAESVEDVDDEETQREKRLQGLEQELDGLYDSYQTRLQDRDTKYKVKEARKRNTEEWGGINSKDDDDSGSESDGGWELMQDRKGDVEDSSDDDSDDDEARSLPTSMKKRPGAELLRDNSKRTRLITKLEPPPPKASQTSKVWFSQDIFNGLDDVIEDDDAEMEEEDEDEVDLVDDTNDDIVMQVGLKRYQPTTLTKHYQGRC